MLTTAHCDKNWEKATTDSKPFWSRLAGVGCIWFWLYKKQGKSTMAIVSKATACATTLGRALDLRPWSFLAWDTQSRPIESVAGDSWASAFRVAKAPRGFTESPREEY